MFDQGLVDVSSGSRSMEDLIETARPDLGVPTDDRPFFYTLQPGLPRPPARALTVLLFSLLLGSGLGGLLTALSSGRGLRAGVVLSVSVAIIVAALVFFFPGGVGVRLDARVAAI